MDRRPSIQRCKFHGALNSDNLIFYMLDTDLVPYIYIEKVEI